MGHFPVSHGFLYISLVDYASRWVEAKATRTNDKVVVYFMELTFFVGLVCLEPLSVTKGATFRWRLSIVRIGR